MFICINMYLYIYISIYKYINIHICIHSLPCSPQGGQGGHRGARSASGVAGCGHLHPCPLRYALRLVIYCLCMMDCR